ncbi:hypothetical protein HS088_TW02G00470 [Tripterygium wilfordii]|uniref:Uncharacterized protein n=1 Tax=Tripterygium wilfordii TaxID=458696 RepID=A0A7J7DZF7_TRIWF|nr:hypothetical protein HS088_TW02G00470 [Tripterygium wilfordii]
MGNQQNDVTGGSNNYLCGIKRVSAIHGSMDRYTKLFEYSFSQETNLKHSKSLSLTAEYKYISGDHTLNSSRRRLSLSDLDLGSLPSFANEVSLGAPLSWMPTRATLDCDSIGDNVTHDVLESKNVPIGTEKFEPAGSQSSMSFENEGGFVGSRNYDELGDDIFESEKNKEVIMKNRKPVLQ